MKVVALTLVFFAGTCLAGPLTNDRIVGGTATTIEEYPGIVQFESLSFWGTWSQSCGGNILNEVYILSAAHCFEGETYEPSRRRIRAGSTFRNTGGVVINIVREFNHPEYRIAARYDADVSVIQLDGFLTFGSTIQQVSIPAQGASIPEGAAVVHAGWGAIASNGPASPVLLYTQIYTVNLEECAHRYITSTWPAVVTSNMICAGLLDVGGQDACQGDSGGPLYWNDVVVGVVSWGNGCALARYPGVSAKVSSYTNWILETAV